MLPWCRAMLQSGDHDDVEDAVGVLVHVGVPTDWATWIATLAEAADDDRRDLLALLLTPSQQQRLADDPPDREPAVVEGVPLGGAYEPFTKIIYFVEASLPALVEARRRWETSLRAGGSTTWADHEGSLRELLSLLEPFAMPSWKSLMVETAGDWSAVFSHGSDLSYVAHYADLLQTRVIRTSWSLHVVRDGRIMQYGDSSLWMWRPDSDGGRLQSRTIQASRQRQRPVGWWESRRGPRCVQPASAGWSGSVSRGSLNRAMEVSER